MRYGYAEACFTSGSLNWLINKSNTKLNNATHNIIKRTRRSYDDKKDIIELDKRWNVMSSPSAEKQRETDASQQSI